MPMKEMPAFIKSHKNVRNAVCFCIACCVCLFIQLILMDKNAITVVFDIIIPFSAAICFGCYAITMAMDRPIILICPPTVYFVSLLINQLIAVEVGVKGTYPFVTMLEMIPYLFFCACVATCKFKKITDIMLRFFSVAIIVAGLIVIILAVFFRIFIFSHRIHYLMDTFAMVMGFAACFFVYATMIELVKIAGVEKKPKKERNAQLNLNG